MKSNLKKAVYNFIPFFMTCPALVWQFLFFIVPLAGVAIASFLSSDASVGNGLFTFDRYMSLIKIPYVRIIIRSLLLSLGTGLGTLLIGYPLAYYIAFCAKRFKTFFLFFLVVPLWTNLLVQIYAWFFILEKGGILDAFFSLIGVEVPSLLNTTSAVALVMVYCYLPYMIIPLYTSLEKIDSTLVEASYDLGASHGQTLKRVIIPLSKPGILTGLFLVMVPAFGEFVIPALVGGDKYMYAGSVIAHYFLVSLDSTLGPAFTILISIVLCCMMLFVQRCVSRVIG